MSQGCYLSSQDMDSQDQEMYYSNLLSQDEYNLSHDDSLQLPLNSPTDVRKCVRARGVNFSQEEDKLLVSACLNCSIDAVQGTDQKHFQLWEKISDYFHQHKETTIERTIKSLTHRWSCIQQATNKFCAKLAQVEGLNQSGMTEQDKLEKAKIMYQSLDKGKGNNNFQFEHCWHLLKNQPKWISRSTKDVSKQKKMIPSPTTTSSTTQKMIENEVIELDRPPGRKAEKRKRKVEVKQTEEIMQFRKMKHILLEESRAQEKEFYRLKVEKMEYDKKKGDERLSIEAEKLRLEVEKMEYDKKKENERLSLEAEKLKLEAEKMEFAKKESDQHIMMMDSSVMPEMQRLYIQDLQREIIMRRGHD